MPPAGADCPSDFTRGCLQLPADALKADSPPSLTMATPLLPRHYLIPVLVFLCACTARAGVRITELHAAPNERFLRWDEEGQPRVGTGPAWFDPEFDASGWPSGPSPMGFGFSGVATDLRAQMFNRTPTLYVRRTFEVPDAVAARESVVRLRIDFDDGFVCFLNGREVARARLGPPRMFVYADATAFSQRPAAPSGFLSYDLGPAATRLRPGTNTIAIQVANYSIDAKGDVRFDAALELAEEPPLTLIEAGTGWQYTVGYGEPSGGVVEPNLPPEPNNPFEPNSPVPFPDIPGFSDWLELHNDGPDAVDVGGWGLTDDPADPARWTFPPGTTIPAGGYLLVLCDGHDDVEGLRYLHAGFKLSAGGETVVLTNNGIPVDSLTFPRQDAFHSFGRDPAGGGLVYFELPTPGKPNSGPVRPLRCETPQFFADAAGTAPVAGGFYSGAQTVFLMSPTPGAGIRYTLDGTEPGPDSNLYTGPLAIPSRGNRRGTVVRARAFLDGAVPSGTATATFLIDQHTAIRGVPAMCFTGHENRDFNEDFGIMAIRGGTYDGDGTWRATTESAYHMGLMHGRAYERPVHIEWLRSDGVPGFSEPAGLRIASSPWSRPRLRLTQNTASPWPADPTQKPSFNIFFRDDYGKGQLDYPIFGADYPVRSFDRLRPRAGKNDMTSPFIKDELVRRLFSDMGHHVSRGTINTLYINGVYKGYYNTVERYRKSWFRSHYNSSLDWDIRINDAVEEGTAEAWTQLMAAAGRNLDDRSNWDAVMAMLDVDEVIDYWLINIYAAMWDWPNNNWVAARERSPEGKWRLYIWDAEGAFGHYGEKPPNYNTIQIDLRGSSGTGANQQSELFRRLYRSAEFRLRFADRINRAFFNGGTLDDRDPANSRFRKHLDDLRPAFAPLLQFTHGTTFGDRFYRNWTTASTANAGEGNWSRAMSNRRSHLFNTTPVPASNVSFRYHRLWPATEPVAFTPHGGNIPAGSTVTLSTNETVPAGSTVFWTTDGTDPREWGGSPSPAAQSRVTTATAESLSVTLPVRLQTTLNARVRSPEGEWSALTTAAYQVGTVPASASNLVVSQFMYHPPDPTAQEQAAGFTEPEDFEFIELRAIGPDAVNLSGVKFAAGISFDFATSPVRAVPAGGVLLLVRNQAAFLARYGNSLAPLIAGEYSGNLSNSGDRIRIVAADGADIRDFTYDDDGDWPRAADGNGAALVLVSPETNPDHYLPSNWQASTTWGGSPGGGPSGGAEWTAWLEANFEEPARSAPAVAGPAADPDGDGLPNLVEFAIGSSPRNPASGPPVGAPEVFLAPLPGSSTNLSHLHVRYTVRTEALAVLEVLAESGGPESWQPAGSPEVEAATDGATTLLFRSPQPAGERAASFVRMRFRLR